MGITTFRVALKGTRQAPYVTEGVTSLLGYRPQDFMSSMVRLEDRIHPHDSDVASLLFSPDKNIGCGPFNIRLRHANGQIQCVCGLASKHFNEDGVLTLNLEMQDAKSLRRELDDRRFSFNLMWVMESVDECVYLIDRNYVIEAANLNTRSAFSDSAEQPRDLRGLTEYDFLPEDQADISYDLAKLVFAGEPWAHQTQEYADRRGKKDWIDLRKYPVKDNCGEVFGLFSIARVVTDRVFAERTLRETTGSLQESQKIAGLGTYVLDIATNLWTSSDVLDEILGLAPNRKYTVEEWTELIHPEDRAMMAAYFAEEVVGKGKIFDHEYRIIRRSDNSERWVHGKGRLDLDVHGRPKTMRGTIQDITERKRIGEALRESQEILQLFIEHAPAALAMFDTEMRYLAVSHRWREDFELNGREIIGHSHYEIFPNLEEHLKEAHRRGLAGESLGRDEDRLLCFDGGVRWKHWQVRPWLTGTGAVGGIMLFVEDITQQKLADERLHLAASVFTHASEGITITDVNGTILDVNDSFTRITGYSREEAIGRNPNILNSGRQSKEFYANMWRDLIEKGHWAGEIWNKAKDGRVFAEMLTISAVPDASGKTQQYVALFSDLTSIKEQEQQLERVAQFDLLTGLPNRVLLHDRLHQAMAFAHRSGRILAVACLDLDNFKSINDRHGHSTGDHLLTAIAHRMKTVLREDDTLARLGGDEFVAVLHDFANTNESLPVVSGLLDAAEELVFVDDLELQVSASVGITYFPQADDVDADQLFRQAAQAMYEAKLEGKNRTHVFDSKHDRSVRGRHEDLERVRLGLAAGEFVMYYQPKVNMRTGAVLGAEALIRWQDPERGLLSPATFLPIIEGHPLAIEIGEWVIDTVLRQIEGWRTKGLDIPVSVNVAAQQLQQVDFVDRLKGLLARHPHVEPTRLEIEVLESSALLDVAQVAQVIQACGRLGVSFALDDFGTGYSSLSYLKRLPVDVLKIDQTFVRDMLEDPEDLTIVEGILGLATAFRREAVAEGVETVEHGILLLRLGCQVGQGYGIARPMPGDDFPGWASSWRTHSQWLDVTALDARDRPLLYASGEHSVWVEAIESFLRGQRRTPPSTDHRHCRLGTWLNDESLASRGGLHIFREIELAHLDIHAVAGEIIALHAKGHVSTAIGRLPELHALCSTLLEELKSLTHQE